MSTDLAPQVGPFDLDRPWRLHDRAAIRPEPFGAMLYHFTTRNLSFLKSPTLLGVLNNLADHPTARAACAAAGVDESELPAYGRALSVLASSNMIIPGDPAGPRRTAPPVSPPAFRRTAGEDTGPAGCRPRMARLTDMFEEGLTFAHLPDLGADLRLQPGVRALPVQFGPPGPA